ncbi:hypothetical protein QUA07_05335 [Microcoleus sp. T3_A4]
MQATTNPIANRAEEQQLLHRLAAGETRAFWHLFQQMWRSPLYLSLN